MGTRLSRWLVWAGWIVSAAPAYVVLSSARWKLTSNAWYVGEWQRIGWDAPALPFIASYVRMGEYYPPLVPLTTAMLAWLGLYLREPRLRALLPIRRSA